MRVELIGVARPVGKVAQHVDAGIQRNRRRAILGLRCRDFARIERRPDIAGGRAEVVHRRPILRAPVNVQWREHGGGLRREHQLCRLIHGVQDGKRRCRTIVIDIARTGPSGAREQVAVAAARTAVEGGAIEHVQRVVRSVVANLEIPGRRTARLDHFGTRADQHVGVGRYGERIVAVGIRRRRRADACTRGGIDRFHDHFPGR